MSLKTILAWGEAELHKLFHTLPEVVKKYGAEALQVCATVKSALASPSAAAIEAALANIIPGKWEAETIAAITKGIAVAVPGITNVIAHGDLPPQQQAQELVTYLQGLSPRMQHAGILKLLSGVFQALDPTLTELEADTAAQVTYAHSVTTEPAATVEPTDTTPTVEPTEPAPAV